MRLKPWDKTPKQDRRTAVEQALEQGDHNVARAARLLRTTRSNLSAWLVRNWPDHRCVTCPKCETQIPVRA